MCVCTKLDCVHVCFNRRFELIGSSIAAAMKGLGMLRKRAPLTSRIDRRKTRVDALEQMLEDSDEGSYCSNTTTTDDSVSEYKESDESSRSSDSSDPDSPAPTRADAGDVSGGTDDGGTDDEKCAISHRRRKRSASASVLEDVTSDSSDSDVGAEPVRKASGKKRIKLSDSEGETGKEKEDVEAREVAAKRKERKKKLIELLKKRKTCTPVRRRRALVIYSHCPIY